MAVDRKADRGFWKVVKPKKINLRHYFGGIAFLLIISQLITGLYMIFYYEPNLRDTYKTIQFFNNETTLGGLTRNIHRYGAFFLGVSVFIHFWRSFFRQDYQGKRKLVWCVGLFLSLLISAFLVSGTILPWEWKGYWMMEMFNNWLANIPVIGDYLYDFFMTSYTPTRNFVIHDIILPITTLVALEIHFLAKIKKRGFSNFMVRTLVMSVPVIILVLYLSAVFPVPAQDPEIIPLPMEGEYIPAPEWFFVTFLLPYWYFPPREWALYLFWIPFILFVTAFALPFINKKRSKAVRDKISPKKRLLARLAYALAGGSICLLLVYGFVWGGVKSPWMGCNSCHNTAMGDRMGIPPVTYKDTHRNPLLMDNRWMMRHWYQPQVVW
ncbi:hypothetical protein MNBD_NITROSPINAE02-1182 [hydrothermal vent metagenome]|uniref:Cytochrome b/b6 N-terminal region profile domain-containing protein n=1 Tax=hydrothermal vent metagenome TaxID=652676 RepID=A0A3B1CG07_9ZZZZ